MKLDMISNFKTLIGDFSFYLVDSVFQIEMFACAIILFDISIFASPCVSQEFCLQNIFTNKGQLVA